MITQNLIIYKFNLLYHILEELGLDLNIKVIFADSKNSLNDKAKIHNNYLIISNKKYSDIGNHIVLENTPINLFKLVEKINIEYLKLQFNNQSQMKVNNYTLDLNSRELIEKNIKLKLTEKEVNIIEFLHKSKDVTSIEKLQSEVWDYNSELETHTVETHIYRLRKKLSGKFKDNNFIQSVKNGYQIK